MFWMRNNENNFTIRTLIWRPVFLTKIMIPKVFRSAVSSHSQYCNGRRYMGLDMHYMGVAAIKPVSGFPNKLYSNQPAQIQRLARKLKFRL